MIRRLEVVESTQREAEKGAPGDVFVAEFQTAGRGRLDHAWQSPRGENLTFSAVLDVSGIPPAEVATLPLVIGLAVIRSAGTFGVKAGLKWPNDVLVAGRKLCGILCTRTDDRVLAGVGLNVNTREFPPEIAARATSLARLCGKTLDREAVFQSVVKEIFAAHALWRREGFAAFAAELAAVDLLRGQAVTVRQTDGDRSPVTGVAAGIAADGALLVDGRPVYAGEAHVESCNL